MKQKLILLSSIVSAGLLGMAQDSQEAFKKADLAIGKYIEAASTKNIENVIAYTKFYRSWYQPVTPAPFAVLDSLSSLDIRFVKEIKDIAKPLAQEKLKERNLVGASTLSPEGEEFYKHILNKLEQERAREQGIY